MPKRAKKKVTKKDKSSTKSRQSVNVKIKIDQSRRTNPRQPGKYAGLPGRLYSGNSSTPLNTTIMTATPSPTILQKEPNYADTIKTLFQEADKRQNNQLALLASAFTKQQTLPPTKELYKILMKEHMAQPTVTELPDEVATQGFKDPNAKAKSKLKTPVRLQAVEEEAQPEAGVEEEKTTEWVDTRPKSKRGRPKLSEEEKLKRASERKAVKEKAKKIAQYEIIKNTRANQSIGAASPLVSGIQTGDSKKAKKKYRLILQDDEPSTIPLPEEVAIRGLFETESADY